MRRLAIIEEAETLALSADSTTAKLLHQCADLLAKDEHMDTMPVPPNETIGHRIELLATLTHGYLLAAHKWHITGLTGPFTPVTSNNDGKVRDQSGHVIADCNGNEALAELLALLLTNGEQLFK